jgi:hypothetical protein
VRRGVRVSRSRQGNNRGGWGLVGGYLPPCLSVAGPTVGACATDGDNVWNLGGVWLKICTEADCTQHVHTVCNIARQMGVNINNEFTASRMNSRITYGVRSFYKYMENT